MDFIIDLILNTELVILEMITQNPRGTYLIIFLIIFSETGLIIFPFFPGDALLITLGLVAAGGALNIELLLPLLMGAAILGNVVNYYIGRTIGNQVLRTKNKYLIKYISQTEEFYEKHGGKAVFYSRFFPIFRTYVPFLAGITKMKFRNFIWYNVFGGIFWVLIFTLSSYLLGETELFRNNFHTIIVIVLLLTLVPFILKSVARVRNQYKRE